MTEENNGLSRRDLIKRGAVVGGVVWAAPVVSSMANPAFASSPPPPGECTDKYRFQIDYGKTTFDTPTDPTKGNRDCLPTTGPLFPAQSALMAAFRGMQAARSLSSGVTAAKKIVRRSPFLLAASCSDGDAKAGSSQGGTLQCDDAEPVVGSANSYVVCLSSRDISHIKGVVCCT